MKVRVWFLAAAVVLALGAITVAFTLPSSATPVTTHLPGIQPDPNCGSYAFGCVSTPPTDVTSGWTVDHRMPLRVLVAVTGVVLALVLAGVGAAIDRGRPTSA